eukprot:6119932-Pleurochrysis_carterae.AAC.1
MAYLDVLKSAPNPDALRSELTMDSPEVQRRVEVTMEEFAKFKLREGIFTRQFVINNAKTMPPAVWWTMYGAHLPAIRAVAQRVLAQPVSASAAERNWSIYGQIKSKVRNRLKHSTSDKLVFCHESLHFAHKLQSSSYEQYTAAWAEDDFAASDSDDSDHEDENEDYKKYAL